MKFRKKHNYESPSDLLDFPRFNLIKHHLRLAILLIIITHCFEKNGLVQSAKVSCGTISHFYESGNCCENPFKWINWPYDSGCNVNIKYMYLEVYQVLSANNPDHRPEGLCVNSIDPKCNLVISSNTTNFNSTNPLVLRYHLFVKSLTLINTYIHTNGFGIFVLGNLNIQNSTIDSSAPPNVWNSQSSDSIDWSDAAGPFRGGNGALQGSNAQPTTIGDCGGSGANYGNEPQFWIDTESVDYYKISASLLSIRGSGGRGGSSSCFNSTICGRGGSGGGMIMLVYYSANFNGASFISRGANSTIYNNNNFDNNSPAPSSSPTSPLIPNRGGGGGGGCLLAISCSNSKLSDSSSISFDFSSGFGVNNYSPSAGKVIVF